MTAKTNRQLSIAGWLVVLLGAFLVGAVAYYFAFIGEQSERLSATFNENYDWILYLLPAIGLTAITLLRVRFFQGTEGTGIPQTIAALEIDDEKQRHRMLSPRILLGKVLLTTLGLFSGASMGREGPTVQAGACIMHYLKKFIHFPEHLARRGLILAGGAAGIAAAFNAPVAGIVFSIEEIGRSFEKKNLGVLLVVVLVACAVCVGLFGDYWFYGKVVTEQTSLADWTLVPAIAITMGLLGGIFSHVIICAYPIVMKRMLRRPILVPMAIGLAIGLLGWISSGQTLGTGFVEAKGMLIHGEQMEWYYAPLRLLATGLTLLSGIPGGLFDPSLSVGAGFGQWISELMQHFTWAENVNANTIMMVSMACFFAGVVQSPITAVVIMVEMTDTVHATMPMLAGAIIAYAISRRICACSLYVALAKHYFNESEGDAPR